MRAAIILLALAAGAMPAAAQDPAPEAVQAGSKIFAQTCAPCHGARMRDPEGAFDLRTFPRGQHDRFVRSVTNGKNGMPPWGALLSPEEIERLWAYVSTGGG